MADGTVTISGPGMEPITLTDKQLERAAEEVGKRPHLFGSSDLGAKPPRDLSNLSPAAKEKLRAVVVRIENLEDEKKEVADQIKDVYAEAKAMGYDTKALRSVVKLRKQDRQEREEAEAVLETYLIALGEI